MRGGVYLLLIRHLSIFLSSFSLFRFFKTLRCLASILVAQYQRDCPKNRASVHLCYSEYNWDQRLTQKMGCYSSNVRFLKMLSIYFCKTSLVRNIFLWLSYTFSFWRLKKIVHRFSAHWWTNFEPGTAEKGQQGSSV